MWSEMNMRISRNSPTGQRLLQFQSELIAKQAESQPYQVVFSLTETGLPQLT